MIFKSLVVNVSSPHYNLGARKLAEWLEAEYCDGDPGIFSGGYELVCLSLIFSWDAPKAREIAWRVAGKSLVWAGGPGLFRLADWFEKETGVRPTVGLDPMFERQRGDYRMTFASRGCPVGCWFCIVPKMEGKQFTLYWDFQPAPILCDNNLSALPSDFQEHIVRRYRETGTRLVDANSGFEPATFNKGTYLLWKQILLGPWRFAFDYLPEESAVRRVCHILRDERPSKKRVYVLIGNEPIQACQERAQKVIEWGAEPYCQPVLPLDALDRKAYTIRYDWTAERLNGFTRYYNRFLWRNLPLREYAVGQSKPFAEASL